MEKGFVYRGKKPVYWSIPCRTALAEAEVEYHDHTSQSVLCEIPSRWPAGRLRGHLDNHALDAARQPGRRFQFHFELLPGPRRRGAVLDSVVVGFRPSPKNANGRTIETVRTALGGELAGLEYQHPFCARTGRLYAGDAFVESSTGTGFVHIAPGHGLEDYQLGRQNGLPIYSPIDDDGRFAYTDDLPREQQMPPEMIGKSTLEKHGKSDANIAVLHLLRSRNVLLHEENYSAQLPLLLAQQDPRHLPRHGPVVHSD